MRVSRNVVIEPLLVYDNNNRHVAIDVRVNNKVRTLSIGELRPYTQLKWIKFCKNGTARVSKNIKRIELNTHEYQLSTGGVLKTTVDRVVKQDYAKRDFVKPLMNYLVCNCEPMTIFAVSGLRGTGKTVGMLQAVKELKAYSEILFITLKPDTMSTSDLCLFLSNFVGIKKYIFIDEVSYAKDFVTQAAPLADHLNSMGMQVVISGTDSFVFPLTERKALYHRVLTKSTSFISFNEAQRLQRVGFDEYLKSGGMFEPYRIKDKNGLVEYIDTAILYNITGTLRRNSVNNYNELMKLTESQLRTLLFRLMYLVICKDLSIVGVKSTNLYRYIGNYKVVEDKERVHNALLTLLGVEENLSVNESTVRQLVEVLKTIGVLISVSNKADGFDENFYFTNSAITVQVMQAIVNALDTLVESGRVDKFSLKPIYGLVMESIVVSHLYMKYKQTDTSIYFYNKDNCEVDIVVEVPDYENDTFSFELYEVKYTNDINIASLKTRWLNNNQLLCRSISRKAVIYRGATTIFNNFTKQPQGVSIEELRNIEALNCGTQFINVCEFLKE